MKLSRWLQQDVAVPAEWDASFNHIYCDSRLLQSGDLFIARAGEQGHGQEYIERAIERGAAAVLVEASELSFNHQTNPQGDAVPVLHLPQLAEKFTEWVKRRYSATGMQLVAVTGTNGKSSVTHYLAQLAQQLGESCALLGTLGNGIWPNLTGSANTTVDFVTAMRLLDSYREQGVKLVAMEVSSHGIAQQRVAGLNFAVAVLTNITQDHLDYHGSMQAYRATKQRLFTEYGIEQLIINSDCPQSAAVLQAADLSGAVMTYGEQAAAQLRYQLRERASIGMQAQLAGPWGSAELSLALLGSFNLANASAAIAALATLGFDFNALCQAAKTLTPVPGRLQLYQKAQAPLAVVDFAHTADALANVLQALAEWQRPLVTVFGCGGNRDRSKRSDMMKVALAHSQHVWLTDDNPRNESPEQIFNDALQGCENNTHWQTLHDRRQAISSALASAEPEAVVLIAGKGHENYQEILSVKHPYSDEQVLLELGYQPLVGGAA